MLDNVKWLTEQRDYHAVERERAFNAEDWTTANKHDPMVAQLFNAAEEITKSRKLLADMTMVLRHRVLVELVTAKAPEWKATHRHYKGTEYRVTGIRWNAEHEELEEMVEYDDNTGKSFVLSKRRWESKLESGKPRYEDLKLYPRSQP